jgi:CheY-like chemotaxis protein
VKRPALPRKFFSRFASGEVRPVPFAKPLILCLEDNPVHLHLRKAVLEKEGYNVIGVTSTRAALEALREAPVCCTISDHMLQGTTGTEVAVEMKRIKPDVPVVLYSGSVPETIRSIDVFINKGEPTAVFLKILRDVIQRYSA